MSIADLTRLLILAAMSATAFAAHADVTLTIERISDTLVRVEASGTLASADQLPGNAHILQVNDIFDTAPGYLVNNSILVSSTLSVGGVPIDFSYDVGTGFVPSQVNTIYFGSLAFTNFAPGAQVSGTMEWSLLDGATFAAEGSTGDVYWGNNQMAGLGIASGSWSMVAAAPVPEPAAFALMGFGLALLASRRKRERA